MVYILIPAHNNRVEVLEVLGCLKEHSYKNTNIILVDDGSTDNTEDEVKRSYPDTIILKGDGNLWWTGANFIGVNYITERAKEDDFILLLNNDLAVYRDYVEILVSASTTNGRAITGSVAVDYDNPNIIKSGIKLNPFLELTVNRDKNKIDNFDFDFDVDVLPGRGTLVPIEVFKKIGNFNNKKLPHYGADYEFFVRAKRAGYNLIVANKAKVFAKRNISGIKLPKKKYLSLKECFYLLFSKKSRRHIYYYLNYIWLCSEKRWKKINVIISALNILRTTFCRTIIGYSFIVLFYPTEFILSKTRELIFQTNPRDLGATSFM